MREFLGKLEMTQETHFLPASPFQLNIWPFCFRFVIYMSPSIECMLLSHSVDQIFSSVNGLMSCVSVCLTVAIDHKVKGTEAKFYLFHKHVDIYMKKRQHAILNSHSFPSV